MANTIYSEIQQLTQPSEFIELFTMDTTAIGGSIYRFTPNIFANGSFLVWQTHTFAPLPITLSGFEVVSSASGGATQPRPTITISNANKTLLGAVISLGDLVGSTLTRVRTFKKFIDGQASADPTQYLGPDIYKVAQKSNHTKNSISWTLTGIADQVGRSLPARQVTKDPTLLSHGFPGVQVY
jgi:lambda family phage minor tail protein L